MDSDLVFDIFKNIIIKQNKALISRIAKDFKKNEQELLSMYLKPEYYLPIIQKHGNKS